jgi:hypothetical protein
VRILLRADSGFAREELMAWCEANGVHFLFGLAKTDRLIAEMLRALLLYTEFSLTWKLIATHSAPSLSRDFDDEILA